jgi:hypothetical protein
MYAGRNINAKSKENITLEAELNLTATAQENLKLYSKSYIGVLADGTLALNSAGSGSWNGGSTLIFSAGGIDLNGPSAATVPAPKPLVKTVMDDTEFDTSTGWQTLPDGLESIVSRAPTHEPYSYHNEGVDVKVNLEEGTPTPPPGAEPVPAGVERRGRGREKQFTINGPATLTREQAQAIFEKQVKTGALTGFKAGDVLSAATQAASGLAGAQAQLAGGISSLGALVSKATNGVTSALTNLPVLNGINPGDFAKQLPGLTSIGSINASQVTGVLAQAGKLTGQPSDLLTNAVGVGSFGLDASQLETAGYVKPGTAAKYLSNGQNSLTSVLKSPSVWTGKDGINQVENLLTNTAAQNKIQQGLMTTGVAQLTTLGLPTDKLNPQLLSGVALNAAKSVTDTLAWAKGESGLPASITDSFNQVAKDGAFAVNLVDEKIGNETLNIKAITGSTNTIDRATLNAALGRVVGNEKIPKLSYSGGVFDEAATLALKTISQNVAIVESKANNIFSEDLISTTVDSREARITALKSEATAALAGLQALRSTSTSPAFLTKIDLVIVNVELLIELLDKDITNIQRFKADLQSI